MKTLALLAALALTVVTTIANAGTRCRTSKSGSVTYTTCEVAFGQKRMSLVPVWKRDLHDMPLAPPHGYAKSQIFSFFWIAIVVAYLFNGPRSYGPVPTPIAFLAVGSTVFSLIVLGRRFPMFGSFLLMLISSLMSGGRGRRRW